LKVVFFGTPEFALKPLRAILESGRHEVFAVVSQPDRPRGRGQEVSFSPVKEYALAHGLKVLQFEKIRTDGAGLLKELGADIGVTAAYGQILSQEIIDIFPYGIYNIHASLLPKYRGASPVTAAIQDGETETGITIMRTELGLDSGDIIMTESTVVGENQTTGELLEVLADVGARLIVNVLDLTESGNVIFTPQDHKKATGCKMLNSTSGEINWSDSSEKIHNLVRAMNPSPSAFSMLNGEKVKIHKTVVRNDVVSNAESGTILEASSKNGLIVKCGSGAIQLETIQMPGKRAMLATDFLRGRALDSGSKFG
jgi:methionyl-tRNA formyltransferase